MGSGALAELYGDHPPETLAGELIVEAEARGVRGLLL